MSLREIVYDACQTIAPIMFYVGLAVVPFGIGFKFNPITVVGFVAVSTSVWFL